jgi:hypothetical protein
MFRHASFSSFVRLMAFSLFATTAAGADALNVVTSKAAQGANDSVAWSQLGVNATVLGLAFTATSAKGVTIAGTLAGANSIIAVVCAASPCSWSGTGFSASDSLLWTSDAGNSGNGPVTLSFGMGITGAGALIQANAPGQFTAQIQAFNGATLLGTFTATSDTAGDATYLGVQDQTGSNITKVVFSLTACGLLDTSGCTDFAIGAVNLNSGPAAASLSVQSLGFGVQPQGVVSSEGHVSMVNLGGAFMAINSITTSGANSADFSVTETACTNPVAPSGSCVLSATFTPTGAGPRKTSISIADSAPGSPHTVILTGVGTAASLSPASLAFGAQAVGTSSVAKTIALSNKGSVAMNLWEIAILGTNAGDFSQASTCGSTLGVGASCTISVAFKPTATGARSASVLISDDGGGSPQAVPLTGTGI